MISLNTEQLRPCFDSCAAISGCDCLLWALPSTNRTVVTLLCSEGCPTPIESLNKKLAANDKFLENINAKVETLSSAIKNQLNFNKMIETQLAQIAAVVPFSEKINAVTTRGGKSTHDPPHPNHTVKATRP